jgi:hypothetical protein
LNLEEFSWFNHVDILRSINHKHKYGWYRMARIWVNLGSLLLEYVVIVMKIYYPAQSLICCRERLAESMSSDCWLNLHLRGLNYHEDGIHLLTGLKIATSPRGRCPQMPWSNPSGHVPIGFPWDAWPGAPFIPCSDCWLWAPIIPTIPQDNPNSLFRL